MEALFLKLLNISITASWVALAVIAFRLVLKKAPKFITVMLWALVAVRLVLPLSVESAFSLIPNTAPVNVAYGEESSTEEESAFSHPAKESLAESEEAISETDSSEDEPPYSLPEESSTDSEETAVVPNNSGDGSESAVPDESWESGGSGESTEGTEDSAPAGGGTFDTEEGDGTAPPPPDAPEGDGETDTHGEGKSFFAEALPVISAIWVAGVVLMLAYVAVSYIRVRRSVREAIPLEKGVMVCDKAPTPFILGLIKPRIYLPSSISREDAKYVLAHERAHIRRGDHLWKPVGFLLLAVYWFNPVMWLAYILLCRDIEYATDEKALGGLGLEYKKPYSLALINCSAPRRLITACPLAFGEINVKSRIKSVLSYKKPALWVMIAAAIACVAILLGFMTNPKAENGTADDSSSISEEEESTVQSSESEADGEPDPKNHGGRVYTVLEHRSLTYTFDDDMSTDLAWENEEDGSMTAANSARKQVLDKVQKEYNCVINTKVTDMTIDMKNLLYEDVLGGTGEYDLCLGRTYAFTDYAEQGLIYDTKKLGIDTSAPWWYSEGINELSICGKQFFLAGDITGIETGTTSVLFFNETLYEENGGDAEALYQLVRDGEWTFDKFKDIVTGFGKDLDDDGVRTEGDLYGLLTGSGQLYNHFISDGNRVILKDENGTPYINTLKAIRSDALLAAVELYLNENDVIVYDSDKYYTEKYGIGYDNFTLCNINPFTEGRGLFLATSLNKAPRLKDTEDNFGILPFPKYSSETERYYSNTVISRSLFVPNSPKNIADLRGRQLADLIDALCRYSSELILPAVYEGELRELNTDKETAMDMLEILRSNRIYRIDNEFHWDTERLLDLDYLPVTGYWENITNDIQAKIDLTVKKLEALDEDVPTSAEKDAAITDALAGTWYGLGADIGKEYVFSKNGIGKCRYEGYSSDFIWFVKDESLTLMYNMGGSQTFSSVLCDGDTLSFIDKQSERSFGREETKEPDDIKWSLDENGTLTVTGSGVLYSMWSLKEPKVREAKHIVIGEGITRIDTSAFEDCKKLETVSLPESLIVIGSAAFKNCTALSEINIPSGVLEILSEAFEGTALYNDAANWENGGFYVDNCLIDSKDTGELEVKEGTVLIASGAVKHIKINKLVLPEGVRNINYAAFLQVESVHIPASTRRIDPQAFFGVRCFTVDGDNPYFSAVDGNLCSKDGTVLYVYTPVSANEVRIPEGIKYISGEALAEVNYTSSFHLPKSLELFDIEAFKYVNAKSVSVDGGNQSFSSEDGVLYTKDGKTLLYYPSKKEDESYTVKEGTELIGAYAFYQNCLLKRLILPEGVKTVEESAFGNCDMLEEVRLAEGLRVIGDYSFSNCYKLKSLVLPDSVSSIGKGAFHSTGLTDLKLGKGLLSIGELAFFGTEIRELYIGTGVTHIGNRALSSSALEKIELSPGNRSFTLVDGILFDEECTTIVRYLPMRGDAVYTLPDGVERIENYAFENCQKLKIIALNDGVLEIGKGAFELCTGLMYIVIPESVRDIRYDQFLGCSSLDTVYFGGSEDRWAELSANEGDNDLTRAEKAFGASIDHVENTFKELKVFATSEYYHDYSVTKDVYYDGTAEGMMKALIKHGKLPAGSKINSLEIRDGTAYLDVNRAYVEGISTGTTMQYEGVGALVNTVIYNLGAESVMLSCEGGTVSLPDVGELDELLGVFSGWLVYEMVEGERPSNALLPAEEEKAMKLMCAFLQAFSEGNTEVCEKLTTYGYPDGEYDFIRSFDLNTADTLTLPEVQRFSYYFDQSRLKEGHVAFSTNARDGELAFELVFVLSYDDVFGVKLFIEDAGYENIH